MLTYWLRNTSVQQQDGLNLVFDQMYIALTAKGPQPSLLEQRGPGFQMPATSGFGAACETLAAMDAAGQRVSPDDIVEQVRRGACVAAGAVQRGDVCGVRRTGGAVNVAIGIAVRVNVGGPSKLNAPVVRSPPPSSTTTTTTAVTTAASANTTTTAATTHAATACPSGGVRVRQPAHPCRQHGVGLRHFRGARRAAAGAGGDYGSVRGRPREAPRPAVPGHHKRPRAGAGAGRYRGRADGAYEACVCV
jgi:hypothetical protein